MELKGYKYIAHKYNRNTAECPDLKYFELSKC